MLMGKSFLEGRVELLLTYTQRCTANVNMKHYRSHSNFSHIGPLIILWHSKQLPVGVANTKPHILSHTRTL